MLAPAHIINAIDESPLNRGLSGAAWLASPGNVPITFENGDIALFDYEGNKVYQIHLLFNSRGRQAIDHVREATRQMMVDYGAEVIFGMVPDFRRDVKMLGRWAGYKFAGKRQTPEGVCELFVISYLTFFKDHS